MSKTLDLLVNDLRSGRIRVIDLTQPLGPETACDRPAADLRALARRDDRRHLPVRRPRPAWYWNTITMGEHTGTHFDAPVHWITGRDLGRERVRHDSSGAFVGPACVIDIEREAAADPDVLVTPARLEQWEQAHGRIPAGAWVLLRTGWSRRTGTAFVNADAAGPHSPGFSADASRLLATDRDVLGVGVETIGTDAGQAGGFDPPFSNHAIMHGAGKFGLASLCNLDQLPPRGRSSSRLR
jgi:kynurenine formamidase